MLQRLYCTCAYQLQVYNLKDTGLAHDQSQKCDIKGTKNAYEVLAISLCLCSFAQCHNEKHLNI